MLCRYEVTIRAACPVDEAGDVYDCVIESPAIVKVEDILDAVAAYQKRPAFQEDITSDLARTLRCKVTTVGFHSGVKTTVVAP